MASTVQETCQTAIVATGATQATATPLNVLYDTSVVTTVASAAASGVSLPVNPGQGRKMAVLNNGVFALNVWPQSATATINGGVAGAAFVVYPSQCITFCSVDGCNWRTIIAPSVVVTPQLVTATAVLTSSSPSVVIVSSAAAPTTITLPAPQLGLVYDIVLGGVLVAAVTIAAGSAILIGNILASNVLAVSGINTVKSNIILGTTSGAGDRIRLRATATQWLVDGSILLSTACTFS